MKPEDIALNELCVFEFYIPQSDKPILADLSLPLEEGARPLTQELKVKVVRLINLSATWYPLAVKKIKDEFNGDVDLRLVGLNILTDETQKEFIFGVHFDVSKDEEHGRGLQMSFPSFEIIKHGDAEASMFLDY